MFQGDDRFTAVQDNATLRAEIKDLNEKLDTLKGILRVNYTNNTKILVI